MVERWLVGILTPFNKVMLLEKTLKETLNTDGIKGFLCVK